MMKKIKVAPIKIRIVPIAAVFSLLFSLLPTHFAFADSNSLFVTPVNQDIYLNNLCTVDVKSYADSDQSVGNATGTVTYPTAQLLYKSVSVSGSGYSSPSISPGSGTVGFNASRNPAPSGSAKIFSITFQAVGTGSAVISFANTSQVNGTATTYTSGTCRITNPNPTTPAPPAPKPSPTPRPSPIVIPSTPTSPSTQNENPQPTPDPTGLIDGVTVDPLYASSSVVWSVHADGATSSMIYGENSSQQDKQAVVTKKSDGTFTTTISGLNPGIRYFFTINASAPGGKSGTYSGVVPTRGFPVTITVTENKNIVQSGQIKIGNQSSPIPAGGKVTLGLAAGNYSGQITTDTPATLDINLTIVAKAIPTDGTAPESQLFAYDLKSSVLEQGPGSSFSIFAFIGILFGGTVILGLGFVGFMAYRRRQFEQSGSGSGSYSSNPTVIIDDGYNWKAETNTSLESPENNPPPNDAAFPGQTLVEPHGHNNSVYLTEEEPLDMFEAAEKTKPTLGSQQGTKSAGSSETPQSPSSLHSTTP